MRLKALLGATNAITAIALKMPRISYALVKIGTPYDEHCAAAYDEDYRERAVRAIKKRARFFGFELEGVCA